MTNLLFDFSFPPPYVKGNYSEKWLYDAVAKSWGTWLGPESAQTIARLVCMSLSIEVGITISLTICLLAATFVIC